MIHSLQAHTLCVLVMLAPAVVLGEAHLINAELLSVEQPFPLEQLLSVTVAA
jgi:hypothetical protein